MIILQWGYLTMKSEWASCIMSFSERMCSCCLVSTMCRFFRIFIAKVLFSSLLSCTCSQWKRQTHKHRTWRLLECYPVHLYNCEENQFVLMADCSAHVPAQHDQSHQPPECRWCWSQPGWDWRKMHSLLHTCQDGEKEKKYGKRISDDMEDERRDNPLPTTWNKISPLQLSGFYILKDWI